MNRVTKKHPTANKSGYIYKDIFEENENHTGLGKLGKLEDLMEKYDINDLVELEIALEHYYHRFDGVHTERVDK